MSELTLSTYTTTAPAFAHTTGPKQAKLAIVGEAWGADEDLAKAPFLCSSGQELTRMLREANIARSQCFLTNVFAFRPKDNDLGHFLVRKADLPKDYSLPPLGSRTKTVAGSGTYVHPKVLPELARLQQELLSVRPNLVLALGATATWALLQASNIGSIRGTTIPSLAPPGLKVLPTYHPAGVMRNWSLRPVVIADLLKASWEQHWPEIRRPQRQVLINPTLEEIRQWVQQPADLYAVDIETYGGQITMIGFARSACAAIVIPFFSTTAPERSYWPSASEELAAWQCVGQLLHSPVPKVFQNGLYDLQYLARMGFRPKACHHDTMLHHHALFPELQKGLGFLASCYSNESAWKLMRKQESFKKDE